MVGGAVVVGGNVVEIKVDVLYVVPVFVAGGVVVVVSAGVVIEGVPAET